MFPVLESIDPILKAIEGMEEIRAVEHPYHGYGFIMYMVAFDTTFLDPETAETPEEKQRRLLVRECRGIIYDLETRKIISRPYEKFFNIGERIETQPENINWARPHIVLDKLDGSMFRPVISKATGKMHMATKRGITEIGIQCDDFLEANPNYVEFCYKMMDMGLTPIFEWMSRKQRIIIDYGEVDRLALTGIRHNKTGSYIRYDEMVELAALDNIEIVQPRAVSTKVGDVQKFIEEVRKIRDAEGYIIRFDDGDMYKIKGEHYCTIHRTFDQLRFEKDVIRLVLSDSLDDAKPFLVASLLDSVDRFHHAIVNALRVNATLIFNFAQAAKNENLARKDYAARVNSNETMKQFPKIVFDAFGNNRSIDDIYDTLAKKMSDVSSSSTNVENNRFLIGGIKWNDFLGTNVINDDD
jgi:T4 RnlA family RNA ligase